MCTRSPVIQGHVKKCVYQPEIIDIAVPTFQDNISSSNVLRSLHYFSIIHQTYESIKIILRFIMYKKQSKRGDRRKCVRLQYCWYFCCLSFLWYYVVFLSGRKSLHIFIVCRYIYVLPLEIQLWKRGDDIAEKLLIWHY